MKNYVKPVVVANDGLAESVYMASGELWTSDCWEVWEEKGAAQEWSGSYHVFEIHASHGGLNKHISGCTVVHITFSAPILATSYAEFPSSVSGNTMTVTRELLGDAYKSGDTYSYKVWATTGDEATTKALSISTMTISCRHDTNVQGELD